MVNYTWGIEKIERFKSWAIFQLIVNSYLLLTILLTSLISCENKKPSQNVEASNNKNTVTILEKQPSYHTTDLTDEDIITDDSAMVFGDENYMLFLHTFDNANSNASTKNTTLTLTKKTEKRVDTLFKDSLHCMHPDISFKDFNNDKVKDVLIFYYTGGRANPTYHLYLTDLKKKSLIRIRGFEELPNPELDTRNNIITSVALAGTYFWSFYTINHKNKLVELGHEFEANVDYSIKFDKALNTILKNRR